MTRMRKVKKRTCESKQTEFTQSSWPDKLRDRVGTCDKIELLARAQPAKHGAVF
jgi:hypothetical protein